MNDHATFIAVFKHLSADPRITVWHFSVYLSFFHKWLANGLVNPVNISRKEIMEQTHIGSIVTYHKCIRQLMEFGYIYYEPTYNPMTGSKLFLRITG